MKSKGARIFIFAVLLVAMTATAASCGGGEETTTTAAVDTTATGVPETATYTDETNGYSFSYPKGWEVSSDTTVDASAGGESAGRVGVYDPEGTRVGDTMIDGAFISVYKLNVTVDDSMMADLRTEVEQVLTSLEEQQTDMEVVEPLREVTINGMLGFETTYYLTKDGEPMTSRLLFLFAGDVEYQITAQSADTTWEKNKTYFDLIVNSFAPPGE